MRNSLPFIFIALAIILVFAWINPQYKDVGELREEKAANEILLAKAEELRQKQAELQAAYASISDDERERLLRLLPDTVDNVRLILDMNTIASKHGISIRNISIDENAGDLIAGNVEGFKGGTGTISLGFTVATTYETFLTFLRDLEESLRIVDVRQVDVATSADGDALQTFNISLDTYWLR